MHAGIYRLISACMHEALVCLDDHIFGSHVQEAKEVLLLLHCLRTHSIYRLSGDQKNWVSGIETSSIRKVLVYVHGVHKFGVINLVHLQ